MFDLVRNNKKVIQIVLAIIVLPFALFGVDSYVRSPGRADAAASVGDTQITTAEFQQALREQQERMRTQLGGQASPEMLDSPELRDGVLQNLIHQRLLVLHAVQSKLTVSNDLLANYIMSSPSLHENGKFSRERYQALVAAQGMSIDAFEAKVKQDLTMQQAMVAAGDAAVSGHLPADRWLQAQLEERVISEVRLSAEQFAQGAKPDAEAVKRYYEENRARFEKPEQVRAAFVMLSQEKMAEKVKVSDEAIKSWYQTNQAQYKQPEQRQASHILIRLDKTAPESDVKAAEAKAEQLLKQIKEKPADFPRLAKQHSQDPGSAERGGDLGYFGRGMMVKPFEEVVFSLKENELSGIVRSDFGLHLIRLTGIRPERIKPLEAVRAEISAEVKRQTGAKLYAEAAESFTNLIYEQSDSLKPVAEKFDLPILESDWQARNGPLMPPFTNAKLMQGLFSDDAIKNKRNTEAVEVKANILAAARVLEHRPAMLEPLEAVSGVIEKLLAREAAGARAVAAGETWIEKLRKGEKTDLAWGASRTVSRQQAANLAPEARNAVFAAAVKELPAYVGTKVSGGYVLYRIAEVKPHAGSKEAGGAEPRVQSLRQQYGQTVAQEELMGWLAALRQRYPVTINPTVVERK